MQKTFEIKLKNTSTKMYYSVSKADRSNDEHLIEFESNERKKGVVGIFRFKCIPLFCLEAQLKGF